VAIAGISMGGTLALQMALDQPAQVSRLVLINTFACLRPKQVEAWLYFASRFALAHLLGVRVQAQAVANHLFPGPEDTALRQVFIEQISQANPAGYRAAMRALARFNVSHRLDQVSAPTLVITGADDSTVPPATQEFLAKHIHNTRHEIIAGAGHAVIVQKPVQINRLLIDFITSDS
jgi:pimeloyl-ACP methyl ester carboxylesterase